MTKEKNQVVTDVNAVISSIKNRIQQEAKLTIEDIDNLSDVVNRLIADYNTILSDYLAMSSLAVKHEKFLEVIGIIEFASANDIELLDITLKS